MLPKPTARFLPSRANIKDFTEEDVRGIISNPIYAGFGPFPALISDEQWIQAAIKQIEEVGVTQFLVNMLSCLRGSFAEVEGEDDVQQR